MEDDNKSFHRGGLILNGLPHWAVPLIYETSKFMVVSTKMPSSRYQFSQQSVPLHHCSSECVYRGKGWVGKILGLNAMGLRLRYMLKPQPLAAPIPYMVQEIKMALYKRAARSYHHIITLSSHLTTSILPPKRCINMSNLPFT